MQFQTSSLHSILAEVDLEAALQGKDLVGYVFDRKDPKQRLLKQDYHRIENRRSVGCAKRVVGGAFSGHDDIFRKEATVITEFIKAKTAYPAHLKIGNSGNMRYLRTKLQKLSQPVIDVIKTIFEHEVNYYLQHFAKALSNTENTLRWNPLNNNCQIFYGTLLKDLRITLFMHPVSKQLLADPDRRNEEDWSYPHYSLSFGSAIDAPVLLLRPQTRSLVWNFYRKKRDYNDLIEFGEQFRTKPCDMPTTAW
jgi:hypothetical protein